MYKTRFAPSPTGGLHIGGARTALFNYLFARSKNNEGEFILRIDDTDSERSKKEYEQNLIRDLHWLGINWNGDYFNQSTRGEIYAKYLDELKAKNLVYPCFCSDERLEQMREEQLKNNLPPKYDGHCKNLSPDEIQTRIQNGERPCWRLRLPENYEAQFEDVVRGVQTFPAGTIGDFVIQRSDGTPTYIFASAVDDYLTKITHIIRGDEHIPNTARQIAILDMLNWPRPVFAHIPMVLATDRRKLSKRNGSKTIAEYRDEGFLPNAILAYLATLSWNVENDVDLLNLNDMAANFKLEKIVKSSPVHDEQHLLYWQKKAISLLKPENIAAQIIELDKNFTGHEKNLTLLIPELINDLPFVKDLAAGLKFLTAQPEIKLDAEITWAKSFSDELLNFDENNWNSEAIENFLRTFMKANKLKGREFFHPMRILLTGLEHGAPLPLIIYALGKNESAERILNAGC